MKYLHSLLLACCLGLLPGVLRAETVVLVHGLHDNGMTWRFHGVTPVLQQNGWVDGGNYMMTPRGPLDVLSLRGRPERVFYTVDLPNRAPIPAQASVLNQHLQAIYAQRQEPLILVGHSAGGLVARYWLLRPEHVPVKTLVTVATPHLGSFWADLPVMANKTPMGEMIKQAGLGKWVASEELYKELQEEKPVNFLYWMNHQPYPPIRYVSMVRDEDETRPDQMDFIVPEYSQDMNHAAALSGRSEVWRVKGSHFLGARDGYALAAILSRP